MLPSRGSLRPSGVCDRLPDFSQIPPRERNHEGKGESHRNASETHRYTPLSGLLNLVHQLWPSSPRLHRACAVVGERAAGRNRINPRPAALTETNLEGRSRLSPGYQKNRRAGRPREGVKTCATLTPDKAAESIDFVAITRFSRGSGFVQNETPPGAFIFPRNQGLSLDKGWGHA